MKIIVLVNSFAPKNGHFSNSWILIKKQPDTLNYSLSLRPKNISATNDAFYHRKYIRFYSF